MALIVHSPYTTPYGTTVDGVYWRWVGLSIDVVRMAAVVTLHGYVDAEAFTSGRLPIDQRQVILSGAEFGSVAVELEPTLSATVYAHVRTHYDDYKDAEDDSVTPAA